MPASTRRIGLSLGADICWPMCFEAVIKALPSMRHQGEDVRVECERLTIEPYDLGGDTPYDVILDRVTHWYFPSRERIKKAVLMDDVYVLNNPWSLQSMEKQTTYCAMLRLGLPVPGTWMVPQKEYAESDDLQPTLERYARHFDLGEVGRSVGFPLFMKPYDGGAWKGVTRIDDEQTLRDAYEQSGRMLMHLQRSVEGFDHFARCIGVGPQVRFVDYDPGAALHDRYACRDSTLGAADRKLLEDMTLTINAFFGWDFNSCEGLRHDGSWYPIDFANACPDGQVTSLHFHFPWLVKSLIKWSVFCAVTKRPMTMCLDWEPFFALARETEGAALAERLAAYGDLARERLSAEDFADFCHTQLPEVDAIVDELFAGELAQDAVRQKVASLFPEHEVEQFTALFWSRIQDWRKSQGAGPDGGPAADQGSAPSTSRSSTKESGA